MGVLGFGMVGFEEVVYLLADAKPSCTGGAKGGGCDAGETG